MLVLVAGISTLSAQSPGNGNTIVASGMVYDDEGEPLPGATVMETGTKNGTLTDVDGAFKLFTKKNAQLTISFVGCEPLTINAGTDLKIELKQKQNNLDEVVVIGYGAVKKKDLTGSVTQVRADNLQNENPATVQDLLKSVAGLSVDITNGPKGGGTMRIRGQNSLNAGSNALLIVDGMIFYGELSEINPDDIEQIDVLKDASAAAVYGAQAANGVILITTKKGKLGKPVINFTANIGFTQRASYDRFFTPDEYIRHKQLFYESSTYGFDADGNYRAYQSGYEDRPGYFSNPDNLPDGVSIDDWRGYTIQDGEQSDREIWLRRINFRGVLLENALAGRTTDWEDLVYRTGIRQDYNVSVSGATEKANYYLSAGYLNNEGIKKGDYFRAVRASMKVNMDVTSWLNIGGQVFFQDRSDDARPVDAGIVTNSPFGSAYGEDGSPTKYILGPQSDYSQLANTSLYDLQWDKKEQGYTVFNTKFNASVKLPYNITYTFNAAPRFEFYYKREWIDASKPDRLKKDSGANRDMAKRFDWSINNIINWNYTFNKKHEVNVTLVQEAEERRYWSEGMGARSIMPTDALGFHYIETNDPDYSSMWTNDTHTTANGLMARGQYFFDNRYLVTASVRRDGYSAFGINNPHAVFPAFAAAWVFSNEKFWSVPNNIMNYGKLRLSYGKNGNRSIGEYVALANLENGGDNRRVMYFINGEIDERAYLRVSRLANPNLKWEKTASFNIGLDFAFLNNRISGNIDAYYAKTTDMIMSQRLPKFSGFENITTNLGQVDNSGVEITLHSQNMTLSNFQWTTDFTFSYNKNTIKHLLGDLDENGKEKDISSNGWFIGRSIDEIWDYKYEGVWQVSEAEEAAKYGQRPGDLRIWNNPDNDIYDEEGNLVRAVFNDDDKQFLGIHRNAPIRMTMRNDFRIFKNFQIGLSMYAKVGYKGWQGGQGKGDLIANIDDDGGRLTYQMINMRYKDVWTPENPTNDSGRINAFGPTGATEPHRWLDRSFLRFDNLSFAYYLPKSFISKFRVQDFKVYLNIQNLGTIHNSKWKDGYGDPENQSYTTRTYTLGLNIKI